MGKLFKKKIETNRFDSPRGETGLGFTVWRGSTVLFILNNFFLNVFNILTKQGPIR